MFPNFVSEAEKNVYVLETRNVMDFGHDVETSTLFWIAKTFLHWEFEPHFVLSGLGYEFGCCGGLGGTCLSAAWQFELHFVFEKDE